MLMRSLRLLPCFYALWLGGLLLGTPHHALAQPASYEAPSTMRLGTLRLKINRHARREIEKKVVALEKGPAGIKKKVERARMYFPIVERVLKEENVPDALKYLAIQESGLVAQAVSSSQAVGFWQFKYPAANEVGLKINKHVDERMHIEAATRGACRYLKRNNAFFNNWVYAITAYYTGRAGAEKYVEEKHMGKKSMAINRKTHWYVIQFLAHYIVFDKAMKNEAYAHPGVYLHERKIEEGGSLSQLAKRNKLPLEDLKAHNAWLLKKRIPDDKEYTVYLPLSSPQAHPTPEKQAASAGTLSVAANLLDTLHDAWKRLDKRTLYTVRVNRLPATVAQAGEHLKDLIARSGLSQRRFLRYNDIDETHKVVQGTIYYLKRKRGISRAYYHIVQPHETLWQIAQLYGIRLKNLMRNNRLDGTSAPVPYTRLWLSRKRPAYDANEALMPHQPEPQDEASTSPITAAHGPEEKMPSPRADWHLHQVLPGENLHTIAEKYGVSVQRIAEWNQIENVGRIREGLALYLDIPREKKDSEQKPSSPKKDAPPKPDTSDYRVKSGDTLHSIAKKHKTSVQQLKRLNRRKDDRLRVGERLLVPRKRE